MCRGFLIKDFHLVLTECEETWRGDISNLFLGHWCARYNRKSFWENLDYIISDFEDIDVQKRFVDIEYCDALGKDVIDSLAVSLNNLHDTKYSQKFWNILLGHWVQLYIKTLYCRYKSVRHVLDNYKISSTTFISLEDSLLAGNCTLGFNSLIQDKYWNQLVYQKILNSLQFQFEIKNVKLKDSVCENTSSFIWKKNLKTVIKHLLFEIILPFFSKRNDAVIINSYLPRKEEIKLQLKLFQFPQFWQSFSNDNFSYDHLLREKINHNVPRADEFEKLAFNLLPLVIPRVFIEGFKQTIKKLDELSWPKRPKYIFTSNNFAFDECFKFYTASKVESYGCKYFVGQHGSNYGTYLGSERWPEVTTPHAFISWGWNPKNLDIKVLPAFNFKVSGNSHLSENDKSGKLLIIKRGPGTRDGPQDRNYEHIVYQNRVFKFFLNLSENIQKSTIVRLHHGSLALGASDHAMWEGHEVPVEINLGFDNIWNLIRRSRLIVHTYDSTTFLETLTLNIPTIGIWREGLDHLNPEARSSYQKLVDVGIIHLDVSVAAGHVKQCWESVEEWWNRVEVQEARREFCRKYAIESKDPSGHLLKVLDDAYSAS